MLDQALEFARRGWLVFPLHGITSEGRCTCGKDCGSDAGKHPVTRSGLKEATKDPEKIRQQFINPWYNIGVVTGLVSGITVIDIDIGDGKEGAESWAAIIDEHGEPETLMSKTGSGGMHVLFKYNSAFKTGVNRLGKGIDIRNDGGYIVAPPSRHRSGNNYEWITESELADIPSFLVDALKKKGKRGRPKNDDPLRKRWTIEQVRDMLKVVDAGDRDVWRTVGIVLGREFNRCDEAWSTYVEWSNTWSGTKGRNHDEIMREAFYELSTNRATGKELSLGTIVHLAISNGWTPQVGAVPVSNFVFYGPGNNFIYRPTTSFWIKEAVDAVVSPVNEGGALVKPSEWLKHHMLCTSMTKHPSLEGDFIKGFDCRDGDLFEEMGAAVFNIYRAPRLENGDSKQAKPFVDHVFKVFAKEGDADQFLNYMAHRVQKPEEKPRFALLIAGDQGVGKDTAVELCVPAIGAWNVANIEPSILDSSFNEYAASTLVRVSEAANLHDMSRWAFNERMKVLIAGNPDNVSINPKYGQKFSVRMYCGVIVTTNHLLTGIYIPPDDRRYDVILASTKHEMGLMTDDDVRDYFERLWSWFNNEDGAAHVAAFLHERDISKFSASNGQRKTEAHGQVVKTSYISDHWLTDALNELDYPEVVRSDSIMSILTKEGASPKEFSVKITPAMMRQGYEVLMNNTQDGRWKMNKKLVTVYKKKEITREYARTKIESLKELF